MPKIILSNGVEFECLDNQSILDAARNNKIAIEHSCRTGRCGICVASVLKGESRVLKQEEPLSEIDSKEGNILTCCRSPLTDLYLNIEDLGEIGGVVAQTLPCRIDSLEFLNDEVLRLILRLPPNGSFGFIAGQYLDLIYGDIRRSYSLASAPRSDGKLEIQIKKVENGVMSEFLFNKAKKNDLLRFEGPLGTFSYRENDSENVVLIATGTGIAPVKAILESFLSKGIDKNIFVLWGGRFKRDLYLDLATIGIIHTFVSVLSRDDIKGSFRGYVQDAVLNLGIDLEKTTVYACGSENMIRAASKLLIKNGLDPKKFYSDAFVKSN